MAAKNAKTNFEEDGREMKTLNSISWGVRIS